MFTEMISPQRILELGTFTGYATLCMAEGAPEDTVIDTIEIFDENEDFLKGVFSDSEFAGKINLIIGDALVIMPEMPSGSYGLIFIAADKRLYPEYLVEAKRLLKPGGYIIADNTLWDGHVIETERNDPQTAGVKRFNILVRDDKDLEKVIIPLRDGLTLIRKLR